MNIVTSIILGLVQGLTEFLPVSSSGHLLLARELFGLELEGSLVFDVFLHFATLLAIIIYFWGDIRRILIDVRTEGLSSRSNNLILSIIVGTIPAVIVGFFWGDILEQSFRHSTYVAISLIAGSILFFIADRVSKEKGGISPKKGLVIGVFQALALIPGVSRSGSTISGGLIFGLSREEAIRFSFLLGIPAIAGALAKTLLDVGMTYFLNLSNFEFFLLLISFLTAFVSGLLAIRFLVRYLANHSFTPFIIYRLIIAGIILFFL